MHSPSLLTYPLLISALCLSNVFADAVTNDMPTANPALSEAYDSRSATIINPTDQSIFSVQNKQTTEEAVGTLLRKISTQAIVPLYKSADKEVSTLQRQIITFCNQPTVKSLHKIRQHWSQALTAWGKSEVALFGPAIKQQLDLHIYFRPVKKRVIKKLLAQTSAISIDDLEFAGVGAQGFATLEYLLFDRDSSDAELLKRFTGDDNRYCQHLLATSTLLQRDIATIYNEWMGGYAEALSLSETTDKPIFTNPQQALELIIGKVDQLAENTINKLRHALAKNAHLAGKDTNRDTMNAYKLEAWRSGHTLANIQSNIQGIERTLKQGGLLEWLKQSGESELVVLFEQRFSTIRDIKFPSSDLFAQIEAKQVAAADTLFDEALALSKLIQKMAPKLGVQLGFNDSDGD